MSAEAPDARVPSVIDRRAACALLLGGVAACAGPSGPGTASGDGLASLTIYSPAPPATPLHALNLQLKTAIETASTPTRIEIEMPAVALPASLETIRALPRADRWAHLPIVTTIDWAMAARGSGPDWHGYPDPYADMRMVTSLYDVGFGIQMFGPQDGAAAGADAVRGKRIGVPPRPSAVRLLTELLLRDGWGVADEVELVDMMPGDTMAAIGAGTIDGTSWNLVLPGAGDPAPMLSKMPLPIGSRYLPIGQPALDRINEANGLPLTLWQAGGRSCINFAQGLAAWTDTPDAVVERIVDAVLSAAPSPGLPQGAEAAFSWPVDADVAWHKAARRT